MKVYVFMSHFFQEEMSIHATLEGAKAQWEKVKNNFFAPEKHEWIEDGLDGTCARMAVKCVDIDPNCDPFDRDRYTSSACIYEMEVQE